MYISVHTSQGHELPSPLGPGGGQSSNKTTEQDSIDIPFWKRGGGG